MATKLKNTIKFEAILVVVWCFWTVIFSMTKAFFSGMEAFTAIGIYEGRFYSLVRVLVIVGVACSLSLGLVLLWASVQHFMSAWKTQEYISFVLDKIPIEILAVLLLFFWYQWNKCFFSRTIYECILDYESYHQMYYFIYNTLRELQDAVEISACLWFSIWLVIRQIVYRRWRKTSFLLKSLERYSLSSELGKKISRKSTGHNLLLFAALLSGLGAIYFAYYEYLSGWFSLCVILFVLSLLGEILYLRISGINSAEISALVEQIRAVSQAEPLHEVFHLSEKSLFYESFHQLEDIDAAAKRSAEKQMQAERLKIDLITNVSHDLKTPLTSMVGYTDLLKQEELSAEAKDYVDIISVKQEQLKEMIQQLFELSKATSGVEQLKLETLDMRKLVEQIIGDMDDSIEKSGRTIRSSFEESPLLFTGDNEKMYRVVQNLLENALKYSLENTRIYINVEKEEKQVRLTIKNIASYEMDFAADEITERFVRGDKSRSTEGHGLGLAIASSFTQNMGGVLLVEVDGDLFKVIVEFPLAET